MYGGTKMQGDQAFRDIFLYQVCRFSKRFGLHFCFGCMARLDKNASVIKLKLPESYSTRDIYHIIRESQEIF